MTGIPSRDWTRGHGIPFDRSRCPEDDEVTDIAAWLAAQFDGLAATPFNLDGERKGGGVTCDCCDRSTADLAIYETNDGWDAVILCARCAAELRELVADSPMEGTL